MDNQIDTIWTHIKSLILYFVETSNINFITTLSLKKIIFYKIFIIATSIFLMTNYDFNFKTAGHST